MKKLPGNLWSCNQRTWHKMKPHSLSDIKRQETIIASKVSVWIGRGWWGKREKDKKKP